MTDDEREMVWQCEMNPEYHGHVSNVRNLCAMTTKREPLPELWVGVDAGPASRAGEGGQR